MSILNVYMRSKVHRWGNSLGLRIPKAFAEEAHIEDGTDVDIAIEDGGIVVRAVPRKYRLSDLVERITDANRHDAVDWGEPVGREAW